MIWREIRQSGEIFDLAEAIWRHEQSLPLWFRAANSIWVSAFREYLSFVENCDEIFGLFDADGNFLACVYVEKQTKSSLMNIHLSIVERVERDEFIEAAAQLRNMLLRRGVNAIRGWILQKNVALARILSGIGFDRSPLVMRYGAHRGRVLRWQMWELKRNI